MPAGTNYCNITGLSENELQFADADNRDIRNAVQKSARSRRLSSKKTQEWLSVMGNPRTANQKPLMVVLRSVMWKIDGKDAAGKMFSKQIRVDIPM
ncbi:MAG: hypothetical protein H7257_06495 [Taibaiella sp.]|nr:hypothetical protein [Taibaiella sp.]